MHSELNDYKNLSPTITRISALDLLFAKQNNLTFYENAKEGDLLLNYPGMSVLYNLKQDKIINYFEQAKAPADLLTKLDAHPETADRVNAQVPTVTKLDDQILNAALANNQQFFAPARSGDYLLEWDDLVVLYDYNNDKVINFFKRLSLPQDFGQKLMAHNEVSSYANQNLSSVNILDATLIEQGKTANPQLFNNAKAGDYLLQWPDLFVVYDYKNDKIVSTFTPAKAPADFLQKLLVHPELKEFATETPRVSIITQDALPQLKEQFSNIYQNAKAGDYVVRFDSLLVIYNYDTDKLVDMFNLQQPTTP